MFTVNIFHEIATFEDCSNPRISAHRNAELDVKMTRLKLAIAISTLEFGERV